MRKKVRDIFFDVILSEALLRRSETIQASQRRAKDLNVGILRSLKLPQDDGESISVRVL